ncbi:MAG TPA: hypothetical protein VMH01_04605 [Puia sp.]|nr:hypothetical protein [Puia sp.]
MLNPVRTIKIIRRLLFILAALISSIDSREQIPLLNSCPPAKATIYLDFNGRYVEGTIWNENGPIEASPAGLTEKDITEIYNRIADDYRIFNLSVTTDSSVYYKAPISQRVRIIFTPSASWLNRPTGGLSFTGSFSWGDDTPAWVFTETLGYNPKYIAACASHEIGHTLGLQHQSLYDDKGRKITEYNSGLGNSETGWAPIMGINYYKNCTTWYTGQSGISSDSIQSDLLVITRRPNNFGFRQDDYSDDWWSASPVNVYRHNFSIKGMINRPGDKDAFRLNICSRSELLLTTLLGNIGNNSIELKKDFKIRLLNTEGETIAVYKGLKLLDQGIDIIINPGVYYLVVEEDCHALTVGKKNLLFYALGGALIDADNLKRSARLTEPPTNASLLSDIQERDRMENPELHTAGRVADTRY